MEFLTPFFISKNKNMKKEPLSIMTVKTLLAVIIFAGIGTIIIGGAYLIGKQSIISLPSSDKSECKIDSDCAFTYTGSRVCAPCDTSREDYKCLNWEEIEKMGERKIFHHVVCKPCQEPQHNCTCSNGKCSKVEKPTQQVTITTDKMEYEQGEMVEITVKNGSDKIISYLAGQRDCNTLPYNIYQFSNEKTKWITVFPFAPICATYIGAGVPIFKELNIGESIEFIWNQKLSNSIQAPNGKYKISMKYAESKSTENLKEIYSNEFTIKEKSVLDPRCSEKVKDSVGVNNIDCAVISFGYEFDSVAEKCVMKAVNGCSFETPFETLEECQEVCEKKENITLPNEDELVKCENDSDCVLVDPEQCDCSSCLTKAINRKYFDVWRSYVGEDCYLEMICPTEISICIPYEAKCDNSKCIAVRESFTKPN